LPRGRRTRGIRPSRPAGSGSGCVPRISSASAAEVEFVGDESRGVHRGTKRPDRNRDLMRNGPYRRTPLSTARPVVAAGWPREAVAKARNRAEETSSRASAQLVASSRVPGEDPPPEAGRASRHSPHALRVPGSRVSKSSSDAIADLSSGSRRPRRSESRSAGTTSPPSLTSSPS
jgi:hypothetical protein